MVRVFPRLACIALASAAAAQETPLPSPAELLSGEPMDFAGVLLGPKLADTVVSGKIGRGHLVPTNQLEARYLGKVRDGGHGDCLRTDYSVQLHLKEAQDDSVLPVVIEKRIPIERRALAETKGKGNSGCKPRTGFYVVTSTTAHLQDEALRKLILVLKDARRGVLSERELDCKTDQGLCPAPVESLARLNPHWLSMVGITSGRKRCDPPKGRTRI